MADNPYIALDTVGVITDASAKAERIMGSYLTTNFSQSLIFSGRLKSLPNTLRANTGKLDNLRNAIEDDLSALFEAYYTNVTSEVWLTGKALPDGTTSTAVFDIKISVTFVTDTGASQTLARALTVSHDRITKVAEVDFT